MYKRQAIFAASLGLSFIALLLFSVMIDIGGSSYYDTFTFMDLAVTVGVFALYFLVIGFSVNISVSYTHLDVYKRQVMRR